MKVEVICSYCGRSIALKEFIAPNIGSIQKPVSHGICPECFEKEMKKIENITISNERKKP